MRESNEVIAILCADIHLQHKAPVWRSAEPDWYEAMRRPLKEITDLGYTHNCPIIIAGDIFTKWNSCPELINFALTYLPSDAYCIPGQHDLPNHQIEDIERSAYQTLSHAGKLIDMRKSFGSEKEGTLLEIHGFPFSRELTPLKKRHKSAFHVAVCHEYKWIKEHKYGTAPADTEFKAKLEGERVKGYDVIVYGDNHKGWYTKKGKTTIWNCGSLIRRHSDEIDYKPRVGLLMSDGSVEPHFLDISMDKFLTPEQVKDVIEDDFDMSDMMEVLNKLGASALDFEQALDVYMELKQVSPEIRGILVKAMETK